MARRKLNRKTRNLITGLLVGAASLYFIAYFLDLSMGQLGGFLLGTLVFVAGVILLAILATALWKGAARLLGAGRRDQDRDDDPGSSA